MGPHGKPMGPRAPQILTYRATPREPHGPHGAPNLEFSPLRTVARTNIWGLAIWILTFFRCISCFLFSLALHFRSKLVHRLEQPIPKFESRFLHDSTVQKCEKGPPLFILNNLHTYIECFKK